MPSPELFDGAESLNESRRVNIILEGQSRGARRRNRSLSNVSSAPVGSFF